MRFNNFVKDIVGNEVKHQFDNVVNLSQNINGGWEVWLQVQLFLRLNSPNNVGTQSFTREEKYNGLAIKSDFAFVPKNAADTKTWVELKVQRNGDFNQAVEEFIEDINKISDPQVKNSLRSNDTAGAVVVIPYRPWDALGILHGLFQSNFPKVGYCLVDRTSVSPTATLNNPPQQSDVQGKVLILYWIAK